MERTHRKIRTTRDLVICEGLFSTSHLQVERWKDTNNNKWEKKHPMNCYGDFQKKGIKVKTILKRK
jgi:hypothetical protein